MPDMISKYKEDIRRDKWKRISQANDDRTKSLFPKENTASILDPYLKKQMTTRFGDKEVITYDKTGVNKLNFQMTKPPDSKDGDGWSEDSISVGTSTTEGMKTPESLPAKLRQLTTSTEQTCPDVPIPLSSLQQSMTRCRDKLLSDLEEDTGGIQLSSLNRAESQSPVFFHENHDTSVRIQHKDVAYVATEKDGWGWKLSISGGLRPNVL
jgi:hypothetical protein